LIALSSLLSGLLGLILYYAVAVLAALGVWAAVHRRGGKTGEWFRKLLHSIQFCSIFPLSLGFQNWLEPVVVELGLCLIIWLLLLALERWRPGLFGSLINERTPGEGIKSLFLSFGTMAALVAVFWGGFGAAYRPVILIGVLTWGFSDLAAALVGKRFGRHHPQCRWIDPRKSWEGSAANALVSFLVALPLTCGLLGGFFPGSPLPLLLVALAAALVSAGVELVSRNGMDTVTVPVAVSFTVFGMVKLLEACPLPQVGGLTLAVCFFAGLGAGLGTGLCGLSAAAVIVPMLFSFLDVPAYQATAVALAADVLASASSAVVYARHRNINMKYGSIMLVSISIATILGSLAAHQVGNFALGSISILVTACLGIKFIWKPVKSHTFAPEGKEERKKIAQSLLCGVGIGGLCGFVGTGGGTLMLIVLTAVIGFDLKTAVGTSVYIMTATALIGSVTHFAVGGMPDMTVLVLTVVFTLLWAQIGAVFANKVSPALMNRVCGVVLLLLGIAMMVMKFAL